MNTTAFTNENQCCREMLRQKFQLRVERNRAYSLRAFARDLKVSHSHLIRVLKGQRMMSMALGAKVSHLLHLDETEKMMFLRQLAFEQIRKFS